MLWTDLVLRNAGSARTVRRSEEGAAQRLWRRAPLDWVHLQQVAQQGVRVLAWDAREAEGDLSGKGNASIGVRAGVWITQVVS